MSLNSGPVFPPFCLLIEFFKLWENAHNRKLTVLKGNCSVAFRALTVLWNRHHYRALERVPLPKRKRHVLRAATEPLATLFLPLPILPSLAAITLPSASTLDISRKWNHATHGLLVWLLSP